MPGVGNRLPGRGVSNGVPSPPLSGPAGSEAGAFGVKARARAGRSGAAVSPLIPCSPLPSRAPGAPGTSGPARTGTTQGTRPRRLARAPPPPRHSPGIGGRARLAADGPGPPVVRHAAGYGLPRVTTHTLPLDRPLPQRVTPPFLPPHLPSDELSRIPIYPSAGPEPPM